MVRGWESRVDLANKRKQEARERKAAMKGPQRATGDVVLNMLLAADSPVSAKECVAWIAHDTGPGKPVCLPHFREEACGKKRCRHSHEHSVALLGGTAGLGHGTARDDGEALFLHAVTDIAILPTAEYESLYLLQYHGECIYDAENADRWQAFWPQFKELKKAMLKSADTAATPAAIESRGLAAIPEETDAIEQIAAGVEAVTVGELKMPAERQLEARSLYSYTALPACIWQRVLSFSDALELCWLTETSKHLQYLVNTDEYLSVRRREYLNSIALTGRDVSKRRKQERKKKIKAANSKATDKKDGHKKVRVCRR